MRGLRAAAILVAMAGVLSCRGTGDSHSVDSAVRERAWRANNRGVALLEQFDYAQAADAFRQALSLNPTLTAARVNLSLALLYSQDLPGAAREAGEAQRQMPSAPQPHYILALIARADNRPADAYRELEAVRRIDPNDVGANVNLGQLFLEDQKFREAAEPLRRAVATQPYNVTAVYNLGMALTRNGDADEGGRMLARAQELRASEASVTYGNGYLEQGRYAEAVASTGAESGQVDRAVPAVSFARRAIAPLADFRGPSSIGRAFSRAELTADGIRQLAAALGGGVTATDIDGDGALDLVVVRGDRQQLWRRDGDGWTDVTRGSGLEQVPPDSIGVGVVAGDYDNDGKPDLFVLRYGTSSLYHNEGGGRFTDVTSAAKLPAYPFIPGAAAWVDVDHDGDLDLLVGGLADLSQPVAGNGATLTFPRDFPPAPLRLLRNNGDGTFTDITDAAGLTRRMHAVAVAPTDYDNHRDIDLLVADAEGAPSLYQNRRDGTFADVAADTGLAATAGSGGEVTAVAVGDVNKDDFPDIFFVRTGADSVLALSNGQGRFVSAPPVGALRNLRAVQFVDYDNDGLLDLLGWGADGPHLLRNLGNAWSDVTRAAFGAAAVEDAVLSSARALVLADFNRDRTVDVVTAGAGSLAMWSNTAAAGSKRQAVAVTLTGRASNRLGVGAKIQVRAGSLVARAETSAATPAIAPADLIFGLGDRDGADTVRVLWPSGTLQAETAAVDPAATANAAPLLTTAVRIEELDRKPSSCPFLFTWNGERFEFITDFMGGGEMGYWEAPGVRNRPDPLEYVHIPSGKLRARDGRFELRVTNELEETLFADRFQLLALSHPRGMDVYPNEGMTDPPKPFQLFAVANARVPRATDDDGHDVTERIARIDRKYPDDFPLDRFRGYAKPHHLTLDVGAASVPPVLLLTAWTDYAFSSDNLAAHQAGLSLTSPSLEVRDSSGKWRVAIADIGIPVGRPQTIPVPLAGVLRPGEHVVRIATNMRVYWDQALVADAVGGNPVRSERLDPSAAMLSERGFSAEVRPDGQDPPAYDYGRVSRTSPWKAMAGRYTRVGDVRDLVLKSDDRFVIAKPGDEIRLEFDEHALRPLPDGWERTFLLVADGFSKEMDMNSASPDRVEPLPFHTMTRYPFAPPEHYPDDEAHRQYQERMNTRTVVRTIPSIDTPRP